MELRIENLTKTYPNGVRALNGISLTIPRGLFGLLGPNGAGKSSLMRTIATLQEFGFYPTLSAEATPDHFAALKGISNAKERKERVLSLLAQVNDIDGASGVSATGYAAGGSGVSERPV